MKDPFDEDVNIDELLAPQESDPFDLDAEVPSLWDRLKGWLADRQNRKVREYEASVEARAEEIRRKVRTQTDQDLSSYQQKRKRRKLESDIQTHTSVTVNGKPVEGTEKEEILKNVFDQLDSTLGNIDVTIDKSLSAADKMIDKSLNGLDREIDRKINSLLSQVDNIKRTNSPAHDLVRLLSSKEGKEKLRKAGVKKPRRR